MDLLRNLFGSLTSGIIRLGVAAGILLLCYLFIVKPVLKTTDAAIKSSGFDQIGKTIGGLSKEIQREVRHSFKTTRAHGGNTQRLVHCIRHAHGNAKRIERCTRRF